MADITSKGVKKALMVIDAGTKEQIEIPLNAQQAILTPVKNLKTWIQKRSRPFKGQKAEIGGKLWFYAYPKGQAPTAKDIETVYDNATGLIKGGMYGAPSDATFGYIAPESGNKLVKDYVELNGGTFFKKLYANKDIKEQGLSSLISWDLADFTTKQSLQHLGILKAALVASFGTVGKWATDAGFTLPTTGTGLRVRAKTYTADAAGGKDAIKDIKAVLRYKRNIGLPTADGGVESDYPFAYGLEANSLITINPTINDAILAAVEASANGFVAGISVDKEGGMLNSINVDGKKYTVEVVDDMPAKGGKAFNWAIEEVGAKGALAVGSAFQNTSVVRPHYEGVSTLAKIAEGTGTVVSGKFLQPEMSFGSFEV